MQMNTKQTEKTPNGIATYVSQDFRVYPPETMKGCGGVMVTMRLCETLEGGRWEGFYSYVDRENVQRTRAAMGK